MNVEPPDFARALPTNVRQAHDDSIYLVQSGSTPGKEYRVDVTTLGCNCASACKGEMKKAQKRKGYIAYSDFCPHLGPALIFHSIVTICALERMRNPPASNKDEPF